MFLVRGMHLAESKGIGRNLLHQVLLLRGRCEVYAPLQDAAAVAVGGDLHGVGSGRVVHELALLGAQPLEAALDDVIAVQIPDEGHNPRTQGFYHKLHLQGRSGCMSWIMPPNNVAVKITSICRCKQYCTL